MSNVREKEMERHLYVADIWMRAQPQEMTEVTISVAEMKASLDKHKETSRQD